MLASRFRTKNSPSNQDLPCIILKTMFPSLNVSLDIKTLMIALNCKFWKLSVNSLSCSSTHFPLFSASFSFPFGNFAYYCVVLLNTLLSDHDKKKYVCNGLLFTGNLDPSSLTSESPVVPLVCGFWRQENLLASCELFINLYELNSCIWFWEEYNPFE